MTPVLSIATVSLDNPDYVNTLLESLVRFSTPFEFLIHGNRASDQLKHLIQSWKNLGVRIIDQYSENNRFYSTPLNELFPQSSGKYFCFLDDDTYVVPEWDILMLSKINKEIPFQMIFSTPYHPKGNTTPGQPVIRNTYNYGLTTGEFRRYEFDHTWLTRRDVLTDTNNVPGNYLVSRDAWEATGGYDPAFNRAGDVDFKVQFFHTAQRLGQRMEFRQVADVCHYHFGNIGTAKIFDSDIVNPNMVEPDLFLSKWKKSPGVMWAEILEATQL